jgi:hypothetical protein
MVLLDSINSPKFRAVDYIRILQNLKCIVTNRNTHPYTRNHNNPYYYERVQWMIIIIHKSPVNVQCHWRRWLFLQGATDLGDQDVIRPGQLGRRTG